MPKKHKVLITGSGGMLGVDLARELGGEYEIYGVDVVDSSRLTVDRYVKADITDAKSIAGIFDKIKPDIVIHTAAWTDVDGCELDPKRRIR